MRVAALRLLGSTAHPAASARAGWQEWLQAHIDPCWRPGEWDHGHWLFTGDLTSPRTVGWACRTPSCPAVTRRQDGRCDVCRRAQAVSGLADKDFDRLPRRAPFYPLARGACSVPGCERELDGRLFCRWHQRAWDDARAGGGSLDGFVASAAPLRRLGPCSVPGCPRQSVGGRGLCRFHDNRMAREQGRESRRQVTTEEASAWAQAQAPRLGPHQFSLARLSGLVRLELLYCLQRRDESPPPLDPGQVRIVASRLVGASSALEVDLEAVCASGGMQYNAAAKGLLRDLGRHLARGWGAFSGADPCAGDTWEVALLDLHPNGKKRYPATRGVVDFRPVGQRWLRELAKAWAKGTLPNLQELRQAIMACALAASALSAAGREDPSALGPADFARAAEAVCGRRRPDGSLHSANYRKLLLYRFCEVVRFGRANGLMAEVPDTFCLRAKPPRLAEEPNEDEAGKALPEAVIAQLDRHLALLGPCGRLGAVPGADLRAMYQAIYKILRDTGRRPGEVVSLKVGCVEVVDGQHRLVYDNHKAGRLRRRLPVTAETAGAILAWQAHREQMPTPPATATWLFPSPLLRSYRALGHLTADTFAVEFKNWVRRIPKIGSEVLGPDGRPLPFDRSLFFPYALRHSYAQRHADAGVPIDVLRDLMDHVSIQTTAGYYVVPLKRKQEAVRRVGLLAVDASGNPAPFNDPLAYERASVSVPFGNCTEPSNVRAGGGHCPIRFQCAGCSFYRPDPSFLPSLEEHIASLRADRETALAMGAAAYVVANMASEIEAFSRIAEKMRRRLTELSTEERREIERASVILRRARAARRLPLAGAEAETG